MTIVESLIDRLTMVKTQLRLAEYDFESAFKADMEDKVEFLRTCIVCDSKAIDWAKGLMQVQKLLVENKELGLEALCRTYRSLKYLDMVSFDHTNWYLKALFILELREEEAVLNKAIAMYEQYSRLGNAFQAKTSFHQLDEKTQRMILMYGGHKK